MPVASKSDHINWNRTRTIWCKGCPKYSEWPLIHIRKHTCIGSFVAGRASHYRLVLAASTTENLHKRLLARMTMLFWILLDLAKPLSFRLYTIIAESVCTLAVPSRPDPTRTRLPDIQVRWFLPQRETTVFNSLMCGNHGLCGSWPFDDDNNSQK